MPLQELQHVVNKFVYHRDLNGTHWVSVEGATIKINRFKGIEKKEKHEKEPPHKAGDCEKMALNSAVLYRFL